MYFQCTCVLFVIFIADSITYNDFCDIMRKEKPLNKESLIKAFKCIDTNGDGYITYDELFGLLTKVLCASLVRGWGWGGGGGGECKEIPVLCKKNVVDCTCPLMLGNPRQSWILDSTRWIPDSRYGCRGLCQWNLDSGFQSLTRF